MVAVSRSLSGGSLCRVHDASRKRREYNSSRNHEANSMLYEIKVELQGIDPPIWRFLQVPSYTSLVKFHRILQKAMGWKNCHLHEFNTGTRPFDKLSESFDLEKAFSNRKTILYVYDQGDGWEHEITLLGVTEGNGEIVSTAGARACPPEDCGGPPGYYSLLVALSDPEQADHDEML